MVQTRRGISLAFEALQAIFVDGETGAENFYGDLAVQIEVVGKINLTHSARAQK